MSATKSEHVCITCKTNEVNPMIGGIEGPHNKSFCSRICQDLWLRSDMQYLSMEALQRIALKRLSESIIKHN